MEEAKRIEIKAKVEDLWDDYTHKFDIAKKIEHEYIFGPLGDNEHYRAKDIMDIVKEVQSDKEVIEE